MAGLAYKGKKVVIGLQDLDDPLRNLVRSRRPDLYPQRLSVTQGLDVDARDLFELRGVDVPTTLSSWLRYRNRRVCLVGFAPEKAVPGELFLVGRSLVPNKSVQAQNQGPVNVSSNSTSKKCKGKAKVKAANAIDIDQKAAPTLVYDSIKAAFHLDSETPHIELTTRKAGQALGTSDKLSMRIYAEDIAIGEDNLAMISFKPANELDEFVAPATGDAGNASLHELNQLRREGHSSKCLLTWNRISLAFGRDYGPMKSMRYVAGTWKFLRKSRRLFATWLCNSSTSMDGCRCIFVLRTTTALRGGEA